jgi:hypothetical protein
MANGSIEDEFSKFEAEIAQLSAPAPTVCQGNHKGLKSFHTAAQCYENLFFFIAAGLSIMNARG